MKYKILITGLIILIIGFILRAFAVQDLTSARMYTDLTQDVNISLKRQIPFWQRLQGCAPYETEVLGQKYKIYGEVRRMCRVRAADNICYFPTPVAKKYALANLANINQVLEAFKYENVSIDNQSVDFKYIEEVHRLYCKNIYAE